MFILSILPGLIWGAAMTNRKFSANNIPQINSNRIVLDYCDLPKIDGVIANLKPKAQAELPPHIGVEFLIYPKAFELHAEWLMQQPEWKPACARLLWLTSNRKLDKYLEKARELLFKAIEHGEFQTFEGSHRL